MVLDLEECLHQLTIVFFDDFVDLSLFIRVEGGVTQLRIDMLHILHLQYSLDLQVVVFVVLSFLIIVDMVVDDVFPLISESPILHLQLQNSVYLLLLE